jgi:hypothetical protein
LNTKGRQAGKREGGQSGSASGDTDAADVQQDSGRLVSEEVISNVPL